MRIILIGLFSLMFSSVTALAATFTFNVQIDSITGPNGPTDVGFYNGAAVGDPGTFTIQSLNFGPFPTSTFLTFPGMPSISGVTGAGGSSSFNPVTGVFVDTGKLGGLTGPWPDFFPNPLYTFVLQGAPTLGPLTSPADYDAYLASVTSITGFLNPTFVSGGQGFTQTLAFSTPAVVSLPAGALLLLSGLGLFGAMRRRA